MAKDKSLNYRKLNQELDDILGDLESGGFDIDEALKNYERGLAIVKQLEQYLKQAENKITKIKLSS